ncbi:MAG TPA: cytochrome c-type biogenesis protein CcmH [Hyphomicrobiaceae bacterium]|nr:cytochrome c-type biogenesis protein CcmH [Hyphomicrobiaceae bacterium]
MLLSALLALGWAIAPPASGVEPDEVLANPVLEARARRLSSGLRCFVCQNQSIDESNAPLARDLRRVVRERLTAGDSDDQVMAFIVARYGDYALLKPRFGLNTLLLWSLPGLLLLGLGLMLWRQARATSVAAPAPLTGDEEARLAEVLASRRAAEEQPKR